MNGRVTVFGNVSKLCKMIERKTFLLVIAILGVFSENAEAQTLSWAFEERFDGAMFNPSSPSQTVLPRTFDYVVTHRTHPKNHVSFPKPYLADHGKDCAGPPSQHTVFTSHTSNGENPDESFFVCKEHMMSSMGQVSGYSVTTFYPKQEFEFADSGILEFDVNINESGARSWWEILITPRDQMKVAAAQDFFPIDETYPEDRIVLTFAQTKRKIQIGTGAIPPDGWTVIAKDWRAWRNVDPNDPALTDRRIRRRHRLEFEKNRISWSIETKDGTMDEYSAELPEGLPFTRGLVLFKTHAYTPEKDGNFDRYTFHWDNIRFSGPVVGRFETFETTELGYLQANGNRPIGDSTTMSITLPHISPAPVLFGQVHSPMAGQVLLSINGGTPMVVDPYDYEVDGCTSSGWTSFRVELEPSWLQAGENIFKWTIGPRPACAADWKWNGFSVKNLEVQFDRDSEAAPVPPPSTDSDDEPESAPPELDECWPRNTPAGALPSQPAPVFCSIDNQGPGTSAQQNNSWSDDFNHGLSFADFENTNYQTFEVLGEIHDSIHWRHANHWMVDLAPHAEGQEIGGTHGGAMLSPDRSFRFKSGKLVIEADVAVAISAYGAEAWPEIVVTTGSQPTEFRVGGSLYAYDLFPGHWTLGCRLQTNRFPTAALMDNTQRGTLNGGRVWEMSWFQHVGTEVFGGNQFDGRGHYWRVCGDTDPDSSCRDRFRIELTQTSLTLYVNGVKYFEQKGIPPLPDELVNGDVYVYFASMMSRHPADTIRYHWDSVTVNPANPPSAAPGFIPSGEESPNPEPERELSVFPTVLTGNPPEERTITLKVDKLEGTESAILTLRVHDPDSKTEGALYINDRGPVGLFGQAARSRYDKKTVDIQLQTPSGWWFHGDNTLRFVHTRTHGYRVEDAFLEFRE